MIKALALHARLRALTLFTFAFALAMLAACGRSDLEGPTLRLDGGSDAALDAGNDGGDASLPPGQLLGLAPDPTPVVLAVGEALQLKLVARFDTGTEADVAARATWTSDAPTVATVIAGRITAIAPGQTSIEGAWGGLSARVPVEVRADKPVRVDVSPAVLTVGIGASAPLTALAVFADGRTTDVTASATWVSTATEVATVTAAGEVGGVSAGASIVAATFDGLTGRSSVTVTASPITALRIDPATQSITVGATATFTATAVYANGTQSDVTAQATWTTLTPGVASSAGAGSFTGSAEGATDVAATFSGQSANAKLTVLADATIVSVTVTPATASLAVGATQRFTATATTSDGRTVDVTASAVWTSDATGVATVSSTTGTEGTVEAVAAGTTAIRATFGGKSGTATVTVQGPSITLRSIAITPSPVTLAFGGSAQLTATGTFSDGSTQNLTANAAWSSSASSTVAVAQGLVSGVSAGTATVTASVGAVSATVSVTVTTAPLQAVTVTIPAPATLDVGGTTQARATGTFADGTSSDITEQCAWSAASTTVASVSNTAGTRGLVSALGAGTTAITATLQGVQGSATITVRTPVTYRLVVAPATASVNVGATQAFTASRVGSDGSTADVTASATWTSSSPTVASIAGATATGVIAGTTTITASAAGLTGTATLTVTAVPVTATALRLSPTTATIAVAATTTFVATLVMSDGSTQDVTATATWSSTATGVATVAAGTVVGTGAGTATITATASGFTATALVTVTAVPPGLVGLTMTPAGGTLDVGGTQRVTVTARFADGSTQDVTAQATLSSTATGVATVANATISGVAAGTATILASYNGLSTSAVWTVRIPTPTVTSIVVTLTPTTIDVAGTSNAIATAVYSDGSRRDVTTTATWTSAAVGVATVQTAAGRVTVRGVAGGSSAISATFEGTSGSATITVRAPTLTNLLILPTSATLAVGETRRFTAQAVYSNNTTVDVTEQATWTSTNTAVATVSNAAGTKGSVSAIGPGTSTIRVTFGGRTASAPVTIARITGIQIRITNLTGFPIPPISPPLTVGQNFQFYAMATFSNGTQQDVTSLATWTSSNPSVLFVNDAVGAKGQATGITRGTAQVRASYQGFNAQQNVTVR
jgi:uncharacterized protein YjdB